MTLEQAKDNINARVVYRPGDGRPERGVIVSVRSGWVFVRYHGDTIAKATRPKDLELDR